jgi:hypothetical protein
VWYYNSDCSSLRLCLVMTIGKLFIQPAQGGRAPAAQGRTPALTSQSHSPPTPASARLATAIHSQLCSPPHPLSPRLKCLLRRAWCCWTLASPAQTPTMVRTSGHPRPSPQAAGSNTGPAAAAAAAAAGLRSVKQPWQCCTQRSSSPSRCQARGQANNRCAAALPHGGGGHVSSWRWWPRQCSSVCVPQQQQQQQQQCLAEEEPQPAGHSTAVMRVGCRSHFACAAGIAGLCHWQC